MRYTTLSTWLAASLSTLTAIAYAQTSACTGDKSIVGYCSITSFKDVTESFSDAPTIDQCQSTCSGILSDAGDWGFTLNGNTPHRAYGSDCSFWVSRADNSTDPLSILMHNQDIVDIVDEVNLRFGELHKGKVAAEGTMVCGDQPVKWFVGP